ncbi:MAG: response regulator [Desulfuromonadaceae bacterium]|nr:response regulator [Desulfuromonadaceae bacterium]MDD2847133.1 response regulator [Desulfuromonadaceae bacterium]MDD4130077.1 response regulator [Desulfuromonadaceae bacterium]
MDGYTTLYGMLETALKQAGEESGMLLGQELSIALSDSLSTSKSSYFGGLDDGCFVLAVDSGEAYVGQFYLLFSLRDAIVMSSILLGIPPARIQEKKRLSIIENDDIDAFSEIANMVNGALNTVFQGALSNKVRLKLLPPSKYIPDIDPLTPEEPIPDGDFLMFRSKLEMPGQEMNYLDVLIPTALGNLFDPQPVEAEAEAESDAGAETEAGGESAGEDDQEDSDAAQAIHDGVDSIVLLEDNEEQRQQLTELVSFTGFQIAEGTLNADIKELFAGRNVKLVIIGSQDANDRELAVCIKVNAIRQDSPPPIIMSAECWTRTAVLKALKYGARDIIIKPFTGDDVTSKVRRYCKIAPV